MRNQNFSVFCEIEDFYIALTFLIFCNLIGWTVYFYSGLPVFLLNKLTDTKYSFKWLILLCPLGRVFALVKTLSLAIYSCLTVNRGFKILAWLFGFCYFICALHTSYRIWFLIPAFHLYLALINL